MHIYAFAQSGDWPMYLHDVQHQSANTDETILSSATASQLKQQWVFKTGGLIASSATVMNHVAYVGSWDGNEYAIDSSGNQLWKRFLGTTHSGICRPSTAGITSGASVINGVVYIGGGDSNWYALDAQSGNILWSVPTGDNSPTGGHYNWSSPLIFGNYAYVGIASFCDQPLVQGKLLKIDLTTHQIVNTFNAVPDGQRGGGVWTSPSIDPTTNTIFVTTGTEGQEPFTSQPLALAVVALDANTLAIKSSWQVTNPVSDSDWGTSPTVFQKDTKTYVAAANKNGFLYVFDASDLSKGSVWQYKLANGGVCPTCGDGSISSGTFDGTKLFYAGGRTTINNVGFSGNVRAFDTQGNVIWEHGAPGVVVGAIAYANGIVIDIAGSTLEVLDATNGNSLFSFPMGAIGFAAPSIANGVIYASTIAGNLFALSTGNSLQHGTRLGGLNIDGYCVATNNGHQALINGIWECSGDNKPVDMTKTCQWQYNPQAVANQDIQGNPFTWNCYQGSVPTQTPTSTPTVTPTPSQNPTRLGGLNIDGYCVATNNGRQAIVNWIWECTGDNKPVNFTSVCQWQYSPQAIASQDISGNPFTWSCYPGSSVTPTNTQTPTPTVTLSPTPTQMPIKLGGLNLFAYCNSLHSGGSYVSQGVWKCRKNNASINMTNACIWQYSKIASNITSKQGVPNDVYTWTCYGMK